MDIYLNPFVVRYQKKLFIPIAVFPVVLAILFVSGCSSNPSLQNAIRSNNTEKTLIIINGGADINATSSSGITPLILAARKGNLEIVNALLAKGANVNASTKGGWTALLWSTRKGHKAVSRRLLSAGADIKQVTKVGVTPLHAAAIKGDLEIVNALLAKGADVNASTKGGWTALLWSTRKGHKAISKRLLSAGANIKQVTKRDTNFIMTSAAGGQNEMIEMAIKQGQDVNSINKSGLAPIMFAAIGGRLASIRLLLEHGADKDMQTSKNKWTALHYAAVNKHSEVVEYLLDQGAKPVRLDSSKATHFATAVIYESLAERSINASDKMSAKENYHIAVEHYKEAKNKYTKAISDLDKKQQSYQSTGAPKKSNIWSDAFLGALADVGGHYQARMQAKQFAQIGALKSASSSGTGLSGYHREYAVRQKSINRNAEMFHNMNKRTNQYGVKTSVRNARKSVYGMKRMKRYVEKIGLIQGGIERCNKQLASINSD